MILKNLATRIVICKDLKICESFMDRMFGLLIPGNPRNLLFKTRFGVHTFFLGGPIDILVLDQKMRVVKLKQGLQPNRLFFWNPQYFTVVELEGGTIGKFRIKVGQVLKIS